ncbi:hypothetical protein KKC91_08850 [bacterium]|nr:hypothetical protein [bacterium]
MKKDVLLSSVRCVLAVMVVSLFSNLALQSLCFAQENQENLVANPSFELDENEDGCPDGWTFGGSANARLMKGIAKTGDYCVELKQGDVKGTYIGQRIKMTPGKVYEISVHYKMKDISGSSGPAVYYYWKKGGCFVKKPGIEGYLHDWIVVTGAIKGSSEDWIEVSKTIICIEEADSIKLALHMYGEQDTNGTIWFDDISVIEIKEKEIESVSEGQDGKKGSTKGDVLCYIPFEKDIQPLSELIDIMPETAGDYSLADGKRGKAIKFNPGLFEARYYYKNKVPPSAINFWIKIEKDIIENQKIYRILQTSFGTDFISLLELNNQILRYVIKKDSAQKCYYYPVSDWVKNKWHYIYIPFKDNNSPFYVDGMPSSVISDPKVSAEMLKDVPITTRYFFQIGSFGQSIEKVKDSILIDELRASSVTLSKDEIKESYLSGLTDKLTYRPPVVEATRCSKSPVIDGIIEEKEWQDAGKYTGFVHFDNGNYADRQTWFYVMYDDVSLYMAFECETNALIQGKSKERDDNQICMDESIEVFLRTVDTLELGYYHFTGNFRGDIYDGWGMDKKWNGSWIWKCHKTNNGWSGELCIPAKDLGVNHINYGDKWRINVCRNYGGMPSEDRWTQWAHTPGSYHDQSNFGNLIFPKNPLIVHAKEIKIIPGREISIKTDISATDLKGKKIYSTLKIYAKNSVTDSIVKHSQKTAVSKGEFKTMDIVQKLSSAEGVLAYSIRDATDDKTYLYQMINFGERKAKSKRLGDKEKKHELTKTKQKSKYLTQSEIDKAKDEQKIWKNNNLGKTRCVLPSWEPLQIIDNKVVTCWNRKYAVGDSIFMKNVKINEKDIFNEDIKLVIIDEMDNRTIFDVGENKVVSFEKDKAVLKCSTIKNSFKIDIKKEVEYDGMVRFDFSIEPVQKKVKIKEMFLELSFNKELMKYFHYFSRNRIPPGSDAGLIPKEGISLDFRPFVWVGDDNMGFAVFRESERNCYVYKSNNNFKIIPKSDVLILRLNFIDTLYDLHEPLQYTVGMQATPVKPLPEDWRTWGYERTFANPWSTLQEWDSFGKGEEMCVDPVQAKIMARRYRKQGKKVMPYYPIGMFRHWLRDGRLRPEAKLFGNEWLAAGTKIKPGVVPRKYEIAYGSGMSYISVCPRSDWADYYMWNLNRMIDDLEIGAVYLDGSFSLCANETHGCGYIDKNGDWKPEYNFFACRDLVKRIRTLFYEKGEKPPCIFIHTSGWTNIPVISFADIYCDGEQYNAGNVRVKEHYTEVLPIDKIRAMTMGKQWGAAQLFLPELHGDWDKPEAPTRELLAMLLIHDILIWPAYCNAEVVRSVYEIKKDFGMEKVEFFPYWERHQVFCDNDKIKISYYKKISSNDQKYLLIVSNLTNEVQFAQIKLDFNVPNSKMIKLFDLENKRFLDCENKSFSVPVKSYDFRLIEVNISGLE